MNVTFVSFYLLNVFLGVSVNPPHPPQKKKNKIMIGVEGRNNPKAEPKRFNGNSNRVFFYQTDRQANIALFFCMIKDLIYQKYTQVSE